MPDQAQGLRALAERMTRRDHGCPSLPSAFAPEDARPRPESERDEPEARPQDDANRPYTAAVALDVADLPLETQTAVADTRLFTAMGHALQSATSNAASAPVSASPRQRARVVAVTSGKGGVGKTNFTTNLALTLAQSGQRVIVMDADLGLANLHVVLGISPRYHLEHVMRGEKTLREALCEGPCGIQIIGGGSGIAELANLDETSRQSFLTGLGELDTLADVILIDTGAGLSRNVMAFLCAVEEIIVVTTPEPTAITDAYATIKVASQENPTARLMLVVNMAQSEAEGEAVAAKLTLITQRFLKVNLDCLGAIPHDIAVGRAVRAQQPFTLSQPGSAAARSVAQIAAQLGYQHSKTEAPGGVGGFLNRMQRYFGFRAPAGVG